MRTHELPAMVNNSQLDATTGKHRARVDTSCEPRAHLQLHMSSESSSNGIAAAQKCTGRSRLHTVQQL